MSRITVTDLRNKVEELNKEFGKTRRTAIRFDVSGAYGGYKIVLVDNRTGGQKEITYGYQSSRETLNDLEKKYIHLKHDVKAFHEYAMSYRK
jgi:hypothetical protein